MPSHGNGSESRDDERAVAQLPVLVEAPALQRPSPAVRAHECDEPATIARDAARQADDVDGRQALGLRVVAELAVGVEAPALDAAADNGAGVAVPAGYRGGARSRFRIR